MVTVVLNVPSSRRQNAFRRHAVDPSEWTSRVVFTKLPSLSWRELWRRLISRVSETGRDLVYPAGPTVYAVGDVHGRADLLTEVQLRIDADRIERRTDDALEVYLGDYVDRGPASSEVIERLIKRGLERRAVFLRGNHEMAFLDFLRGQLPFEVWKRIGGAATVQSYGISASQREDEVRRGLTECLPTAHLRFLEHLQYFEVAGPYLFVHAGIRPGLPLAEQDVSEMLNIRDEFLDYTGPHEHVVVHGHTPTMAPEFRKNRINIDTGAFATNRLTCLRIDQDGAKVL